MGIAFPFSLWRRFEADRGHVFLQVVVTLLHRIEKSNNVLRHAHACAHARAYAHMHVHMHSLMSSLHVRVFCTLAFQ